MKSVQQPITISTELTQAEQISNWITSYKIINNKLPLWREECMLHIKEICGYDPVKSETFRDNIYHHIEHSKSSRAKYFKWIVANGFKYIDVL